MSASTTSGALAPPSDNQPLPRPAPQIRESDLQTALDRILLDALLATSFGLAGLYILFAAAHTFLLPGPLASVMAPLAAGTAIVLLGLAAALRRTPCVIPERWANSLAASVAALALANSLVHLALASDILQTTNVMLLVIGAGFLLFSTPWLALVLGAAWAGWGLAVWSMPAPSTWSHWMFAMLSATVVAAIVHTVRVRSTRRLIELRLRDEFRSAELTAALHSAEKTRRALELDLTVAQRVASILDLDALLTQVAELAKQYFGYYYVGIYLLENGDSLATHAGTGFAGQALREQGYRVKVGEESVIGQVAGAGQPVRVDDTTQDSRYTFAEVMPLTRSELALPLKMGDKLLGVLDIQSDQIAAFKPEDVPVLELLAGQVAIAIQNAFLYRHETSRRRLSETLYEVWRALSGTLDLTRLLDIILEQLAELVPYDRASIMLPAPGGDDLEFAAARGFPAEANPSHLRVPTRENDLFQRIAQTCEPLLIPEVSRWSGWQYVETLPEARSWMGIPLIRSDKVIGMLSITRETPTPFVEDDATLGIAFATQAAMALENARLYDELRRAYEQLGRLDRTKSDFIQVVSHELRTPLTVLRGASQMLAADPAINANEMHRQLADSVNTGSARLHEIVNIMLDMAKIDSRTLEIWPEPVRVRKIIREVCGEFDKVAAERCLSLTVQDMADLPNIEADPVLLRKVFYQLVVNAVKYTPDGGSITISGCPRGRGYRDLNEPGIEVVVSDTGIGIAPEFHELIFAKFYQTGEVALHSTGKTKFKGGGPGLGLAIAKGIVEAHGGAVWVESPGYDEQACPGSSFHLVLPLTQKKKIAPRNSS